MFNVKKYAFVLIYKSHNHKYNVTSLVQLSGNQTKAYFWALIQREFKYSKLLQLGQTLVVATIVAFTCCYMSL